MFPVEEEEITKDEWKTFKETPIDFSENPWGENPIIDRHSGYPIDSPEFESFYKRKEEKRKAILLLLSPFEKAKLAAKKRAARMAWDSHYFPDTIYYREKQITSS